MISEVFWKSFSSSLQPALQYNRWHENVDRHWLGLLVTAAGGIGSQSLLVSLFEQAWSWCGLAWLRLAREAEIGVLLARPGASCQTCLELLYLRYGTSDLGPQSPNTFKVWYVTVHRQVRSRCLYYSMATKSFRIQLMAIQPHPAPNVIEMLQTESNSCPP